MRSGNADLGAGIAQTKAKPVYEAGDLSQHVRANNDDIFLRVIGGLFAVLLAVSIGSAYAGNASFAWMSFGGIVLLFLFGLGRRVMRSMYLKNKRESDILAHRSEPNPDVM